MENFQFLKFLDLFKSIFKKMGVDYGLMRKILQVKLTMDKRRVPTVFHQNQSKEKKEGNQFLKSLWLYALFGLALIPFILFVDDYFFQMSIVFGMAMFILMTSMISDFSTVLLDVRDKLILSTKPIDRKTINAAKLVHICIYMFLLTAAVMTIPLIVALVKHGFLFFVIFLIEIIFVNLFIVVFTALLYLFILTYFDGERLKDLINYVQILLSVGTIIGYQLVIRSFEFVDFTIKMTLNWWQYAIPPLWYGAPYEWLLNGNNDLHFILFSVLAFVVPIISIIVYIKLMPTFERNLEKLSEQTTVKKKRKPGHLLANVLCRKKEERTFYHFALLMMKNEREFKLKVYPSLGLSLVLPFLFFVQEFRYSTLEEIASSYWYLTIYACLMVIPTVIMMLKYSGKYKGSWLYKTTPIQNQAAIYKGTLKAFLVKLFLPVFLLLSIVFTIIFNVQLIPHLFVVLLSACIYTVICFKTLKKAFPFSESFKTTQQGEGITIFVLILVIGAFIGLHYLFTIVLEGIYYYLLALLVINLLLWKERILYKNEI